MRVYQLARKLNLSGRQLLKIIAESGLRNKTTLSSLTDQEAEDIRRLVAEKIILPPPKEKKLVLRDPVVAVLGHVDHGKTSLLDIIRHTQKAKKEVGGITQCIGASEVYFQNKRIVFIDTPGHEVFTAMRAHGARVTDIVVLVVAADDGVMPQTVEAINHARAAKVPIVVAINKIDREEANIDRVKTQLTNYDLTCEDWGGETICVPVSAVTGEGVNELLDMIVLEAEMLELSGDPEGEFQAVIIESTLDKQTGPSSTLLIQQGSLRISDTLVGEDIFGRVKSLINWERKRLKKAGPSTPVIVLGLSGLGSPGQILRRVNNEKKARQMAMQSAAGKRIRSLRKRKTVSLDTLYETGKEEEKSLNVILKADTQGSLGALQDTVENFSKDKAKIYVIHGGVGEVNKSDILLASASRAVIISFNVETSSEVTALARGENVEIRSYQIIYNLMDDIEKAVQGLLTPEVEEVIVGKAQVKQLFKVPRVGVIVGCLIIEGKVIRGAKVRILREDQVVGEGNIASLKRFNRDVNEVQNGFECGINLQNFNKMVVGDTIVVYQQQPL